MASASAKKKVLFDDSDDESDGGVDLQINDAYAKRFEHNKKREELQRCQFPHSSQTHITDLRILIQTSGGKVQIETSERRKVQK
jgi:hypothetical protein